MNKKLFTYQSWLLKITMITFLGVVFCQCKSDNDLPEPDSPEPEGEIPLITKAAFDDYFEWDRLDKFPIYNPNIGRSDNIELPWAKGSTVSLGIPNEWLDPNAYSPTFSERYYSRENNWVLVYSNLTKNTVNKYFALYNTHTGLLRFFVYALSNASGGGVSSSYWGIRVDKSTSLFNFTTEFADDMTKKIASPSYITSPPGTVMGTQFIGKGYQVNNWYGLEVECAYDPSIAVGTLYNFEMMGWAVNKTTITGDGKTDGSITGTVEFMAPTSNFNISLSEMFKQSNSKTNIVADNGGVVRGLGDKIEEGISKNDSFFKGLWNNIKRKAMSGIGDGVKNGLQAIFTSGGSVAAKALTGAVSSILGIGGSKPSVGKVDLRLSSNTKFTFEAEQVLPGWGTVSQLPIPGCSTNPNDMPLYNESLGVWNLSKMPILNIEGISHDFYINTQTFYKGVYNFRYYLDCTQNDLIINSAIRNKVTISSFNVQIAAEDNNPYIFGSSSVGEYGGYEPEPFGWIGNKKYYSKILIGRPSGSSSTVSALYGSVFVKNYPVYEDIRHVSPTEFYHGNFKAVVSFDMKDNATGKVYSFSKWFNVKLGSQTVNYKKIEVKGESDCENYINAIKNSAYPPASGYYTWDEFDIKK